MPLGSRVWLLSIRCASLALRNAPRGECMDSSGTNLFYVFWENSSRKIRAQIGWNWVSIKDRNTELARSLYVMMRRAKRIYTLMIKVKKLFSFFTSGCFLKEISRTHALCFYQVIKTLLNFWENSKLACGSCSYSISCSPERPLVFCNFIETRYMFSIY